MLILTYLRKLYKALSADSSPSAIAFATGLGLTAGFLPLRSGFLLVIALVVLLFRVQITTAILTWTLGRLLTLAGGAALFARIGEALLEAGGLAGFWTWFLNLPGVAWFRFEYHAVLGGAVAGVLIGAVLFQPVRLLVISYRRWAHDRVSRNRFFRWLTNFWFVKALRFVFVGP